MKTMLTAVVIAGCATVFFSALPADARIGAGRIAANGLAPMPVNERVASGRIAANGLHATGLDLSRIGQKALGK
jgi:hypothetical protein